MGFRCFALTLPDEVRVEKKEFSTDLSPSRFVNYDILSMHVLA